MRGMSLLPRVAVLGIGLTVAGCGGAAPDPAASAPPAVTVVKVASEDVRPSTSFTGRIEAKDKVELRARVEGFLEKRLFTEGADVKEGELLFVIEKGLYQAALEEAQAGVEKAEALLQLADIEVERQTDLFKKNVAAKAKLDEVTAKQGEARGALLAEKAQLEKAKLQLSYTDISAPIAGRISRATVSVGNFVRPTTGALATIVSQDPIYVSFPVTQREILVFRKENADRPGAGAEQAIYLRLADGSRYATPGKLDFLGVTVNPGTDTVQVRAIFANPDRILVDGQLVSVVAESSKAEIALLVPSQALQLDQAGSYVLVVGKDNKVEVRRVELGESKGTRIVVRKGLTAGELVITEGIQKVRPGQVVQPIEAQPGV
jgi:membrane fusion protein (multidrug efflux system)